MPSLQYVHDQSQCGFFNESGTYNSQAGSIKWVGMVTEHEVDEDLGVIPQRYVGTASRNVGQFIDGPTAYNNVLRYHPQDWQFLYFALGKVTDGGSPSPYLHTVTEANGDNIDPTNSEILPSFQVEDFQGIGVAGSNFRRTFAGCMVNSMNVNITEGEPVTAEVNYVAQSVTYASGAKSSITARTDRPFLWQDFNLHIPSGTTFAKPKSISIGINNNLLLNHYVNNTRNIGVPTPQSRDYEVTVVLNSQASNTKTLYDQYFLGGSTFNMLIPGVALTGSRIVNITFSGCKMVDITSPTLMEGAAEQTLLIRPQAADVTSTDDIQFWRAFSGA